MNAMTEAQCIEGLLDAPHEVSRWAVFADLLTAAGDPRGELISLALAHKTRAERLYREKHHQRLGLTRLLHATQRDKAQVSWEHGHPVKLSLRLASEHVLEVLTDALRMPMGFALATLALDGAGPLEQLHDVVAAVTSLGRGLREVAFHQTEGLGGLDATALLSLPRLERLSITGVSRLGDAKAASLLRLLVSAQHTGTLTLGRVELPRLKVLTLHCWVDSTPSLARWLREGCVAPKLVRLTVETSLTSQVIEAIADAPFAASLEELRVGTLDDASVARLSQHREKLKRLKKVTAHYPRYSLEAGQTLDSLYARR